MVLDDPIQAIGVAAIVFFVLLGVLYLRDVQLAGKRWFGIVFLLIGVTILLFLLGQPGLGGVAIATIGALFAKGQLESQLRKRGLFPSGPDTFTRGRNR